MLQSCLNHVKTWNHLLPPETNLIQLSGQLQSLKNTTQKLLQSNKLKFNSMMGADTTSTAAGMVTKMYNRSQLSISQLSLKIFRIWLVQIESKQPEHLILNKVSKPHSRWLHHLIHCHPQTKVIRASCPKHQPFHSTIKLLKLQGIMLSLWNPKEQWLQLYQQHNLPSVRGYSQEVHGAKMTQTKRASRMTIHLMKTRLAAKESCAIIFWTSTRISFQTHVSTSI